MQVSVWCAGECVVYVFVCGVCVCVWGGTCMSEVYWTELVSRGLVCCLVIV